MSEPAPRPPELEDLMARILDVPRSEIAEDADQKNMLRWDSVTHIALITAIEAAYGVAFEITDIIAMDSLRGIRAQLRKKGRAV